MNFIKSTFGKLLIVLILSAFAYFPYLIFGVFIFSDFFLKIQDTLNLPLVLSERTHNDPLTSLGYIVSILILLVVFYLTASLLSNLRRK